VLLAACNRKPAPVSQPTADPTSAATAALTVEATPAFAATIAAPTPTVLPVFTPDAPAPTVPPAPTPTAVPSTLPTATPAPTSQPTADPTVPPSPTPSSNELLASGRWHQLIGDCDTARRELAALLNGTPTPADASEARYRMAQCYLRDNAAAEAMVTLKELLSTATETDPYRAPATFTLGEALSTLGSWRDAEAAYTEYLSLAPELKYLTWQRIGAARRALDDLPGAVAAYKSALAISPDWTNTVAIRRALADLALAQNNPREAVAQYDALRGKATSGAWAAEMQYLAGSALAKGAAASILPGPTSAPGTKATPAATPQQTPGADLAGIIAEAQKRWQAAVDADVTSAYAHSAIVALLDSGAPVDEYQRGVANYYRGNYELAIAAFDRLAVSDPAGRKGNAWYYAGLSYLALEDIARGSAELDRLISTYPDNPLWADAWMAKARGQARAGQTDAAIATYRRLAELRPDAPQAPKALWQAAILQGQPGPSPSVASAEAYLALARRYPKADEGWRAYQAAGLTYFQLNDWQHAAGVWREMAESTDLADWTRPVAYFWLGRAQAAAGDREAALRSWQTAQSADPESFYGQRAATWTSGNDVELVSEGAEGQGSGGTGGPAANPPAITASDSADIAVWLETWAGEGSLDLPKAVTADPDWQRGMTLMGVGLRLQALTNWGRIQTRYANNPWTMAALAVAFDQAGAHRLSLLSAEQVIGLSGKKLSDTPVALQRLAYPYAYTDLIRDEADKQGLDPRLMLAIIRQESRFETGAASSAGAQGLMQVMPGTAQSIAGQLAWPNFQPQQAYWPYVNVAFGSFYIHQWLEHFGGSIFTALAAYNGGPGNATVWHGWAPTDDDLFAALININETRVYIQAVWTNYEAYRRLYP